MSDLSVSIALCTFNGEPFLEKQLNSLAEQTRQPDELVVCDDGSTDRTIEILENFALKSSFPVKIFRNEKTLNYSKNFEKSASLCSKDLIFFCDQDDVWQPEKISRVVNVFEENPEVGHVFHAFSTIDAEDHLTERHDVPFGHSCTRFSFEELEQILAKDSTQILCFGSLAYYGCMYAYRRVFNDVLIPFFPIGGHDLWVMCVLGALTDARFLPEHLSLYRLHSANTSRVKRNIFQRLWMKCQKKWNHQTKQDLCRELVKRISSQPVIRHPEVVEYLKEMTHFYYRQLRMLKDWLGIRKDYMKAMRALLDEQKK